MKFDLNDIVSFLWNNERLVGEIWIRDFNGALGFNTHTYDIFVEELNCLFKHIIESDIILVEK